MKSYIISTISGYYYTTLDGKYGRFGDKKLAMRMCEKCKDENIKSFTLIGLNPVAEKARKKVYIMPTCREHLTSKSTNQC